MSDDSLWMRLRRARIVQVLLVYLGAAWAMLEVADLLQSRLSLPAWVTPVTLLLLMIGLVIILSTAWIQSHPVTTQRQDAGDLPGAWELAPREIGESIRKGRLPHLTWGRSILGGVFAFWFLFGLAGLYVVFKDRGRSFAPEVAVAEEAGDGIAIVPFAIRGDGLELWREGMVDLFSTSLDDVGGYRTIDSRTVLARWREAVPEGQLPDLSTTLGVGRRAGARYVMTGSAVAIGTGVRLAADVHEVDSGEKVGGGQVEGPADSVLSLVDRLSVQVMETLLREGGSEILTAHQAASLTTASLPALKAYLEGEVLYRQADFPGAIEAFERATQEDGEFALAHYRLSEAYGWLEDIESSRGREHLEQADRLAERLRPRDRAIVEGNSALIRGDLSVIDRVRETTRKYPDDPEAWFLLAEYYVHHGDRLLTTIEETDRTLSRAVELDPEFAPYYIHLIEYAIMRGDSARAAELLERYRRRAPPTGRRHMELAFGLFLGDSAGHAAARAALDTADDRTLELLWFEYDFRVGRPAVQLTVLDELLGREHPREIQRNLSLLAAGKADSAWSVYTSPAVAPEFAAFVRAWGAYWIDRIVRPLSADTLAEAIVPAACGDLTRTSSHCALMVGSYLIEEGRFARVGELVAALREAAEILAAAGDTARAAPRAAAADGLEAYARWRSSSPREAIAALRGVQGSHFSVETWSRYWLARLHLEAGEERAAVRYLESLRSTWLRAWADHHLGTVYLALGEPERARAAYASLLQAWEEADPGLPWEAEAREALETLLAD